MRIIKNKYIFKKVIPASLMVIAVFTGIIRVNIINTRTLSPLGNSKENYEIVSEKFGEDFSKFIKDNSALKIYCDKDDDILIRINDTNFKIKTNLKFLNDIKKYL